MTEPVKRKYTDAKREANKRYNDKTYDKVTVVFPKGTKEIIIEHAKNNGESMNAYIARAVTELLIKENSLNSK